MMRHVKQSTCRHVRRTGERSCPHVRKRPDATRLAGYTVIVMLDARVCYRALRARDRRFDGTFFVAVRTTGIYCRPICPARIPSPDRCSFFARAAEAEREGYRACFRCRPELAPGLAPVDSTPRLVRRAVAEIDGGCLDERSVDALAEELGVTSRHLRRAMEAELGVSPIEYAQTKRLALAKQLLHDTSLPLADVAFAAGFGSIRRFNALFKKTFARAPSDVRRNHRTTLPLERDAEGGTIALRLDYRPPLAWDELLAFLQYRAIRGVESVSADGYRRTVRIGKDVGWLEVHHASGELPALVARVSMSLASRLTTIVAKLRTLFDLDAQPDVVAAHLGADAKLRALVARRPGLRLPGAFDAFEMAVRAVLGQQVSVKGASTLCGRLVKSFGKPLPAGSGVDDELVALFPTAAELAQVEASEMRKIGLPEARARTIVELARAVASGRVDLTGAAAPESAIEELETLPGIGSWTAHYLAMRGMHWPDAFPAGDLGVKKALGTSSVREAEARAAAWRPWRAYALMHLWSSLAEGGP